MIFPRSRRGIQRSLVAAVLLLVIAGGSAAGALFFYYQTVPYGGNSQTSTQALLAAATNSSSSITPSASLLGTVNATECLLNGTSILNSTGVLTQFVGALVKLYTLNDTAKDLFGNFSEMAVSSNLSINGSSFGGPTVDSYTVVGRPVIDSLNYYEVNFTSTGFGTAMNETALFAPNGTAISVTSGLLTGLGNYTGSSAAPQGEALVSPFLYELQTSAYSKSIVADSSIGLLNQTTASLGATSVNITYYTLKSPLTTCGSTITKVILGVGTAPGSKVPMILYDDFASNEQGTTIEEAASVVSLSVAGP